MDDNYALAWLVVLGMSLGGGVALWFLLRPIQSLALKLPLVVVTVLLFITPASIPGYDGHLAPALVVAIFEAFFQIDGKPDAAILILAVSLLVGALLAAFLGRAIGKAIGKKASRGSLAVDAHAVDAKAEAAASLTT